MKTLRNILLITSLLSFTFSSSAQDSIPPSNRAIIYSVFINIVPDGFNFPLIGFINMANGNHKGVQVGFVNTNEKNLDGVQTGFVNTTGGYQEGIQVGFVNTTGLWLQGIQTGFVNTVGRDTEGAQVGFVNTTGGKNQGFQAGFINTSGEKIEGIQTGFVNTTGALKGFQLGFINYADSLESGLPLGFISIIRNGGYKAIELSFNESYPVNLGIRLGIDALYSIISAGYNPDFEDEFAFGFGLGSILPLSDKLFFNPELMTMDNSDTEMNQLYSFATQLGINLQRHWQLVFGPSLTWQYQRGPLQLNEPLFTIYDNRFDIHNRLFVGMRVGVRYRFDRR